MNNARSKASNNRYSHADVLDYGFNQQAGAHKTLGPILGKVSMLGALNAAKGTVQKGALVAVYNNAATTAFVKTGTTSGITAPTGGADGICLPPYSYTTIAMGSDTFIISDTATCFGYLIDDDLLYNSTSGIV